MSSSVTLQLSITIPDLLRSHWPKTLGTHTVSSGSEVNDIQNVISKAKTVIVELDEEMGRVQQVLTQMSLRRSEICAEIEEHKALLSPVHSLPDELLSEIFRHHCQSLSSNSDKFPWPWSAHLLLTQICSRWRAVALAMPALWSEIHVSRVRHNVEGNIALIKTWLQRSSCHPLTLILGGFNTTAGLEAVLPTCDRWQHMTVHSERACNVSLIRGALPSLQSLTLNFVDVPATWDIFEVVPQLHSVNIAYRDFNFQSLKLPWVQLTHFSLSHITELDLDKCLDILRVCPNLISCHFSERQDTFYGDPKIYLLQPRVQHLHLQNMSIALRSGLGGFLNCLTLPALRTVNLVSMCDTIDAELVDLLSRSSCMLVELVWNVSVDTPTDNFVRCLDYMPELIELDIVIDSGLVVDTVICLLTPHTQPEGKPALCPKLQVFRCGSSIPFKRKTLFKFIKSRWSPDARMSHPHVHQLTGVLLRTYIMPEEELVKELRGFRDHGLALEFTNYDEDINWFTHQLYCE